MDAAKVMENIIETGRTAANDSAVRVGALAVGDHTSQGDVNFTLLASVPQGAVQLENPSAQLAPGTTKGSRHCIEKFDGLTMYRLQNPSVLQGPVILATQPFTVAHPEHGDQTFPAGVWFVTYQRVYAAELRRVQD